MEVDAREREHQVQTKKSNADQYKRLHVVLWRLERNVGEMWNFLRHKFNGVQGLISYARGWHQATSTDLSEVFDMMAEWRNEHAERLSRNVQQRFRLMQNPNDCSQARRLVCDVTKLCGFGCQVHHLVFCFTVAYGDRRTVIVDSYKWQYAPYRGSWESVFQVASNSCVTFNSKSMKWWEKPGEDHKLVKLSIAESLEEQPPFIPLAVPQDLAAQINQFHRQPSLWWIGQIVGFLLRPSMDMQVAIDEFKNVIGFSRPIVG